MHRIGTLLLLASSWTTSATEAELRPRLVLEPGERLVEALEVPADLDLWIAVDGGPVHPLERLGPMEAGMHDVLVLERSAGGEVLRSVWLEVEARDRFAGGDEAYPLRYEVDLRPPRIQVLEPAVIRPDAPLPVLVQDESGIAAIRYRVGERWLSAGEALPAWSPGRHEVLLEARDHAGNSARRAVAFEVDGQAPEITLRGGGVVVEAGRLRVSGRADVEIAASDAGSGLSALLARFDDGPWAQVAGPLSVVRGARFLEVRATDRAGNDRRERWEIVR